jgi:hypothetical protein
MSTVIRSLSASILLIASACEVAASSSDADDVFRFDGVRTRMFDGATRYADVGLDAPDLDHDYIETCESGSPRTLCTIWACIDVLGQNTPCDPLGSYPDHGGLPADADWGRATSSLPAIDFVKDDAAYLDEQVAHAEPEAEECHANSAIHTSCVDIPSAGAVACTMTMCGYKSYYVCCGSTQTGHCTECS